MKDEDEVSECQASRTVRRYVESVPAKEFVICISVGELYKFNCSARSFSYFVDGKVIALHQFFPVRDGA